MKIKQSTFARMYCNKLAVTAWKQLKRLLCKPVESKARAHSLLHDLSSINWKHVLTKVHVCMDCMATKGTGECSNRIVLATWPHAWWNSCVAKMMNCICIPCNWASMLAYFLGSKSWERASLLSKQCLCCSQIHTRFATFQSCQAKSCHLEKGCGLFLLSFPPLLSQPYFLVVGIHWPLDLLRWSLSLLRLLARLRCLSVPRTSKMSSLSKSLPTKLGLMLLVVFITVAVPSR